MKLGIVQSAGYVSVAVMQAIEHRRGNDFAFDLVGKLRSGLIKPGGNPLLDTLMRTMLIGVLSISNDDAFELVWVENEEVI